jgi:hypothetical protein
MKKQRKPPAQMELFQGRREIHALGLLGWEDALWTKPIEIRLLSGETLRVTLQTLRAVSRKGVAANAESSPNQS